MGVRQRHEIANYLNITKGGASETYALMGAGFTDLNENPTAQVTSKKYINDKAISKSITGYDWSTAFTTDQIREEEAVEYICNIGEKQLTGKDAETDYIIVDLTKPDTTTATLFAARKFRVAIEVASFENVDGEMTASGNLLAKGDPVDGQFDVKTKTFTVKA